MKSEFPHPSPVENSSKTAELRSAGRGGVPAEVIDAMLTAGVTAYQERKFKPWRFLVIRDRRRLAMLQRALADLGYARLSGGAVIAIFTSPAVWKRSAAAMLPEWARDQQLISRMLRSLAGTEVLRQQLQQLCLYMDLAARAEFAEIAFEEHLEQPWTYGSSLALHA